MGRAYLPACVHRSRRCAKAAGMITAARDSAEWPGTSAVPPRRRRESRVKQDADRYSRSANGKNGAHRGGSLQMILAIYIALAAAAILVFAYLLSVG